VHDGGLAFRPCGDQRTYYDTMLADTTSCSTLANFHKADLDVFHVELDRPDSSPKRRQMYLDWASDVEYRQAEVGCE
jgi:hypothetical protein